VRFVFGNVDLNRQFPGKADGDMAEKLAYAIYHDIADKRPSLVLDLHEAINNTPTSDFLGSSIIFTSLDGITELFMDMYFATQMDELCSEPYNYFGPGPIGSINNTVTNNLGIPVITLETYRAYPLERRVMDHLALAGYVLKYNGMVD
jgi:predicted deacylase